MREEALQIAGRIDFMFPGRQRRGRGAVEGDS